MSHMNATLAACIVIFALGCTNLPPDANWLIRIICGAVVIGALLIPAGYYWYKWLNKTN